MKTKRLSTTEIERPAPFEQLWSSFKEELRKQRETGADSSTKLDAPPFRNDVRWHVNPRADQRYNPGMGWMHLSEGAWSTLVRVSAEHLYKMAAQCMAAAEILEAARMKRERTEAPKDDEQE